MFSSLLLNFYFLFFLFLSLFSFLSSFLFWGGMTRIVDVVWCVIVLECVSQGWQVSEHPRNQAGRLRAKEEPRELWLVLGVVTTGQRG